MVVINPAIKKQLKDLQKIPYGRVKNESAIIVDLPIGQLKTHDLARALSEDGSPSSTYITPKTYYPNI